MPNKLLPYHMDMLLRYLIHLLPPLVAINIASQHKLQQFDVNPGWYGEKSRFYSFKVS